MVTTNRAHLSQWQIDNAARCGCRGADDMCPCQNDPDLFKPKVAPQPVAWGLYNPATGKLDHRCYQREEAARAGAASQTNRWRTIVAVPLFLYDEPRP